MNATQARFQAGRIMREASAERAWPTGTLVPNSRPWSIVCHNEFTGETLPNLSLRIAVPVRNRDRRLSP